MSSITGRSASSGEAFDSRLCADIGSQCQRFRTERNLTPEAVGKTLLLSKRQVSALESADASAFHNSRFYLAALHKYATFAGVDPALIERATPATRPSVIERDPIEEHPRTPVDMGPVARGGLAMMSIAGVVVAVVVAAGGGYVWWQQAVESSAARRGVSPAAPAPAPPTPPAVAMASAEVPAAPLPDAAPPSASPEPVPLAADPATSDPVPADPAPADLAAPFGSVRVTRGTWIFLRYIDNSVVERPLAEGERAVFDKPPVYLAVGTPDAELTLGNQRVNTAPFIVNGQLRVRASDFNALTGQGGEPPVAVPSDAIR